MTFDSSVHNPKIMLGMLVKILRGDSIATRIRFPREGNVTFEDFMSGAPNFDARTITIEGLTSARYLVPITVGIVTVIATIRSAGLSWSHDICSVDGEIGSLSNVSVSERFRSGDGRCCAAFLLKRQALPRRHPRWARPYFQHFLCNAPPKPASLAPFPCLSLAGSRTWSLRRS
jgi:hypothetical protein